MQGLVSALDSFLGRRQHVEEKGVMGADQNKTTKGVLAEPPDILGDARGQVLRYSLLWEGTVGFLILWRPRAEPNSSFPSPFCFVVNCGVAGSATVKEQEWRGPALNLER